MVTSPQNDIETIESVREEVSEAVPELDEQLSTLQDRLPADNERDGALDAGLLIEMREHDSHEGGRAGQFNHYAREIEQAGGAFDDLYNHLDEAEDVMSKLSEAMAALSSAANALETLQQHAEWAQNNPTRGDHRNMKAILDAAETAEEKLDESTDKLDELQRAIPEKQTLKEAFQSAQADEYRRRDDDFDF